MGSVNYEVDGRVAILTLNRPDSLNAVNPEMVAGLLAASSRAAGDSAVRAVVVRGAGKSFMAGGDLRWFREQLALPAGQRQARFSELIAGVHASILNFKRMEKPVVAAVQEPTVVEPDGRLQGRLRRGRPFQDFLGPVHAQPAMHVPGADHLELGRVPERIVCSPILQLGR